MGRSVTPQAREARHLRIWQRLGKRQIIYLRFNPDQYTDELGVSHPSCFGVDFNGRVVLKSCAVSQWTARLDTLGARLITDIENKPKEDVTVEYLFYGEDSTTTGPDYAEHAREVKRARNIL